MDEETRLKLIIKIESFPCSLDAKHKVTVTKLTDKKFNIQCFDCFKFLGIEHKSNGTIKDIK